MRCSHVLQYRRKAPAAVVLLLIWAACADRLWALNRQVVVVAPGNNTAYREAVRGVLAVVNGAIVIELSDGSGLARLAAARPALVIAIGAQAAGAAAGSGSPVLVAMVSAGEQASEPASSVGTVILDIPFSTVLERAHGVWPRMHRVGVLQNSSSATQNERELANQARRFGYTCQIARCRGPEDLLEAFASLKGKVDFVWCPPDGALFNSTTVKPLVMASLRHRLPIIGFSEAFLRAGAAVGVYPDFYETGVQTGELARQWLQSRKRDRVEQTCRGVRVGVNQRVLRLLGIDAENAGQDVTVIR